MRFGAFSNVDRRSTLRKLLLYSGGTCFSHVNYARIFLTKLGTLKRSTRTVFFLACLMVCGLMVAGGAVFASGKPLFTRDLSLGAIGNDVQRLQKFLNKSGFLVAKTGPGSPDHEIPSFGPKTKKALQVFQNQHSEEILQPLGLSSGTGNFFVVTRGFVNGMMQSVAQKGVSFVGGALAAASDAPASQTYTIGGTITGITGVVVLQNNDGEVVTIRPGENSAFTFPTALTDGQRYSVTVKEAPVGQRCYVSSNSEGVVRAASVHTIEILCGAANQLNPFMATLGAGLGAGTETHEVVLPRTYTIGGSISGLSGTVVLQNNGGNDLSLSENGAFAFSASLADAASYAVTVQTQPTAPEQVCTITSGTGSVSGSSVTSVNVTCLTRPEIVFHGLTKTYGNSPFSLHATTTSDGEMTFTSGNLDVATISGTTLTIIGAGTSTISVLQDVADGYASTTASALLTVNKATPVLTFNDVTHAYDAYPYAFVFDSTNDEGGTFSFLSDNETVATIDDASANIHASGTAMITLTQSASANYEAASTTAVLTVPGVCAVGACGDYSTSCTINTVSASCSCVAGVTGARCSIGIDACAAFPCGIHGMCTRVSTLGGISPPLNSYTCSCDSGFHGASCSLDGDPPAPTITFLEIVKYVGDSPFSLAVTSTSDGAMSFLSSDPSIASVSGGMCTVVSPGTTTITVNQASQGYLYASGSSSTLMTVYENYCTAHDNPCQNGGACTPNLSSFSCSCTPGFSGSICDLSSHNCDGSEEVTCDNGGMCVPDGSGGACACPACYMGTTCSEFDSVACA